MTADKSERSTTAQNRREILRRAIDEIGGIDAAVKEVSAPSYPGAAPHAGLNSKVSISVLKALHGGATYSQIAAATGKSKNYLSTFNVLAARIINLKIYYEKTKSQGINADTPLCDLYAHLSTRLIGVLYKACHKDEHKSLGIALCGLEGRHRSCVANLGYKSVSELKTFLATHGLAHLDPWR
jgi:hypothetical protein